MTLKPPALSWDSPNIKLYEIKHPYYMNEGCYYANDNHQEFNSFDEFLEEWGDADEDMNLVFRWDWNKEESRLKIYYVMQRKGYTYSAYAKVKEKDHERIRQWLSQKAGKIIEIWEPFLSYYDVR